jgi:hypothetical protein
VDERERRLAQNEALFREVNERVSSSGTDRSPAASHDYLCECSNPDCTFQITLGASEYEAVRVDPRQFVVLPGHYMPEIEDLVTETDRYWIVRKVGAEGEFVEKLDPRSR